MTQLRLPVTASAGPPLLFVAVQRLLATALACLIAAQATGLSLREHWCGGRLAAVTHPLRSVGCCAGAEACHSGSVFAKAAPGAQGQPFGKTDTDAGDCCGDDLRWERPPAVTAADVSAEDAPPLGAGRRLSLLQVYRI